MANFWDADTPAQAREPNQLFPPKAEAKQREWWLDDAPASANPSPPSAVEGVVEWVSSLPRRAGEAIRGQNEFDIPELSGSPILTPRASQDFPRQVQEAARTGGAGAVQALYRNSAQMEGLRGRLNAARGEEAQLDILRQFDPTVQTARDRFGNTVIRFQGQPFYLNRSGMSARDGMDLMQDAAIAVPFAGAAARAVKGFGLLARTGAQGVAGGLASLTRDAQSAAAGSRQGVDLDAAAMGAAGGAAGEVIGSGLSAVLSRFRNNPAQFVRPDGSLTDDGARMFTEAGIDAGDVTQRMGQNFAERARQTGTNTGTAREAAAAEFNIPLSRGQATGDFDQIAFEQSAQRGARGQSAGAVMREFDQGQRTAVRDAFGNFSDRVAPRAMDVLDERQAGETVAGGLQRAAEASRENVGRLYDTARGMGASIRADAVQDVGQTVRNTLSNGANPVIIDDALTPFAARALREIDELSNLNIQNVAQPAPRAMGATGATNEAAEIAGVSFDGIEQVRKRINALYRQAPPTERGAIGRVMGAFDDWFDNAADRAMLSGSDDALEAIKKARAAYRNDRRLYGAGRSADEDAGNAMQRLLSPETTAQEAANILYGTSKVGESGVAVRLARRIEQAVGRNSPEFDALRRGIISRMVQNAEDAITQPGAQAMQNRISEFIGGRGSDLSRVLFTPDEIGQLRRLANVLRTTVPPQGTVNHSGTGYEIARSISQGISAGENAPFVIRMFTRWFQGNAVRDQVNASRAVGATAGAPRLTSPGGVVPSTIGSTSGANWAEGNDR